MDKPLIDILWVLVSAGLVFVMQPGFLALEAGLTRSKNSINVAVKNIADFGIATILYWIFGFALMFGLTKGGWIGSTSFLAPIGQGEAWLSTFFLYQLMFCATAVTIISGAVAERTRFSAYLIISVIVSGLIYPLFGHWAWGGAFEGPSGWLAERGFIDFAGSTVVHSVGGWAALAVLLVVGPRAGRFPIGDAPRKIPGSNIPLALLGVLLLWFGWIGFNGGSTLALNEQVPGIIANTMLAGGAGLVTTLVIGQLWYRYSDPIMLMSGALAGLVAITANVFAVDSTSAVVIGAIGAIFMLAAQRLMDRLHIDDVVGAVPVHMAAGVWGTVAVALFGDPEILGTGLGRWSQLEVQLTGIGVCFLLAFGLTYLLVSNINRIFPFRVTPEQEYTGLNVAEHRATTEVLDLLTVMDAQTKTHDLSLRAPVEPFTEVGQIANLYNSVMEALQQVTANNTLVLNSAGDGILGLDAEGRVTFVNPAGTRLLGWESDELINKNLHDVVHYSKHDGTSYPSEECPILGSFRDGDIRGADDEVFWRRDGASFPVRYTSNPIRGEEGGVAGAVVTFQDITSLKRTQELQYAHDIAVESSLAKSEFLATMSHELRTPLNAIIGYSEMLKEEAEDLHQEDFIPDLQRIREAGTHLLTLINDILDLSRVEAGRTELYLETFNVSNMVREAVAIIQPLVEKNANTLEVHCEDSIGSIRADMTKVRQTLFNLLSNACKFTEQGTITVDVSRQTEHGQDWLSFSVADTGIGMTPEQMSRLFQPFSQADASTTRQYGGTGLGLVLSRRFCQMMGGDITVESEYGRGSTFTFKLPTEVVEPTDEPGPPEEPSPDVVVEGASKVLVIDDDPLVHDMMKRLLSTGRFHVESASDGEMGLRLARDLRPDIITLDVFMPGMDGWAVLALLKADPDLSSIPVIMLTIDDNKNRGYMLGTSEYMVKPIERDRLTSVLNRYRPDYQPCSVLVVEDNVETRPSVGVSGCRGKCTQATSISKFRFSFSIRPVLR